MELVCFPVCVAPGVSNLVFGSSGAVETKWSDAHANSENTFNLKKSNATAKAKALISARPKMAFEVSTGNVSQYPTFFSNKKQLYKMFYDANAPDKGASQQLFQLSKILSPDIAKSVLSYSGSENSAQTAADWLSL